MRQSFHHDPVGYSISYLFRPRPLVGKDTSHATQIFVLQFILNRVRVKVTTGASYEQFKIECESRKSYIFGRPEFFGYAFHKLPKAFGLAHSESWYHQLLNTNGNLNYVGAYLNVPYYETESLANCERSEFLHGKKEKGRFLIIN
jgi:hypothetical protein